MAQAQQISPKQVKGLQESLNKLDSLVPIKQLGDNLELTDDGTLNVTGAPNTDESNGDIGEITGDEAQKVSNLPDSTLYDIVGEVAIVETGLQYTFKSKNLKTGATSNKTFVVPFATATTAGLITAEAKKKLDGLVDIKAIDDTLVLDENGKLSVKKQAPDITINQEVVEAPEDKDVYSSAYINTQLKTVNDKMAEVESDTTSQIGSLRADIDAQLGNIKKILDAIDVGDGGTGEGGGESIDLTELKEKLEALNTGAGVE